MLLLVAVMNELFAAFSIGVGSARRIRCDVGMAFVGGRFSDAPKTFICEGGIQAERRWILPRMCWGMRRAVARP